MTTVPFTFRPVEVQPDKPGVYDTIEVLRIETDAHGKTTYTYTRQPRNTWDGQEWKYPLSGWREHAS